MSSILDIVSLKSKYEFEMEYQHLLKLFIKELLSFSY